MLVTYLFRRFLQPAVHVVIQVHRVFRPGASGCVHTGIFLVCKNVHHKIVITKKYFVNTGMLEISLNECFLPLRMMNARVAVCL